MCTHAAFTAYGQRPVRAALPQTDMLYVPLPQKQQQQVVLLAVPPPPPANVILISPEMAQQNAILVAQQLNLPSVAVAAVGTGTCDRQQVFRQVPQFFGTTAFSESPLLVDSHAASRAKCPGCLNGMHALAYSFLLQVSSWVRSARHWRPVRSKQWCC